jgi:glucose/arabinose dehydrogenase
MKPFLVLVLFFLNVLPLTAQQPPQPLVTGLKNPTCVGVGQGGKVYVGVAGNFQEGAILRIDDGKAVPFVTGLGVPRALAAFQQWLYVTIDNRGIYRIDANGKAENFITLEAFPERPGFLQDIAIDPENGTLYVTDARLKGAGNAVYRITPRGKVSVALKYDQLPGIPRIIPWGIAMDGVSHLLMTDGANQGSLYRIKLANGTHEKLADGFHGGGGMAWDHYGRLFAVDKDRILTIARPGEKPIVLAEGFRDLHSLCLDPSGKNLLVTDREAGTLTAIPIRIPGWEVDDTPLSLHTEVAFPDLQWTGWQKETKTGQPNPLRPLLLTHAGDGSNRVFVGTQHGVIHVFPNDQKAAQTTVFLDLQHKVKYNDATNEEGFLGLAFHPKYKENGEFFVFYTIKQPNLTNVVSRFRVRKDDPNRADPDSEEVLLTIKKPFWNHDGGTILFGPDGYLYITHGDGGLANDPYDNGQKMSSLLGKILRIDVNRKENGKNYAIPPDNPFVNRADARPEIWAYGLRNVWRMAFDPKTGKLWAADVGQNLYEEINLIERGGNYGWNRREGVHPFGSKGTGVRKEFIEPIWEYHHDIGKSITGGTFYRGQTFPELHGHYLYADYVSGRIWALRYDEAKGRVVANHPIKDRGLPIMSFGEDEKGEVYLMTFSATGQGIYRFARQR